MRFCVFSYSVFPFLLLRMTLINLESNGFNCYLGFFWDSKTGLLTQKPYPPLRQHSGGLIRSEFSFFWPTTPLHFTRIFLIVLHVVSSHRYTVVPAESKMGLDETGRGLLVGRRSVISEGED